MHVKHPLVKPDSLMLREYQETVFSRAMDANTLVVLPTGLGKTVIAAMLAAHRLHTYPESKVLFLAPTRPLAVQHYETFRKTLNVEELVTLTGMDAAIDRKKLWTENKVIFATPQTIENDLIRGLDLSDVSLIVFDECHRSVGDYSYVFIAEEYMKKAKNPLILGLTASPSSDQETVKEISRNLFIERVEARTEKDRDVREYVQETAIAWVKVELPPEFMKIRDMLEELLREELRRLKNEGLLDSANLSKVNKRALLELQAKIRKDITSGIECYAAASFAASALKLHHALELLETQGLASLDKYLERLRSQKSKAIKRLFSDKRMDLLTRNVHDLKVMGLDHPKLQELVKIVKQHEKEKVMVFTQYRDSVDKIVEVLNENDVLAREFIGQASKGAKKGMSQKKQINALEDFREGKYNVLVATSVAEEGLDIPAVDLVVFYEPIPSEIRSIQRRGRTGRSEAGKVIVLMAKKTRDEGHYWASIHKERKMREVVEDMQKDYEGRRGQKSLTEYSFGGRDMENNQGEAKKLKIVVDGREKCIEVMKTLREKADIEIKQLPVGDFVLSDRVVVERKTIEDFLSSIIDKRLFNQAGDLARNYSKPFLIIEGREDIYSLRGINPNAIRGAIASLAMDYGVHVIYTRDEPDTGNFLLVMARREQEEDQRSVSLHGERKPFALEERQRYVIESLPNVSAVLAKRLLEKYGTVHDVMEASKKDLMTVTGIGEGKAEEIIKTIRSRYIPKNAG